MIARSPLLILLPALVCAQIADTDRYPEIRRMIGEAESAIAQADLSKFSFNPYESAARLYGLSGYWTDALRLAAKAGPTSPYLNDVRILYGNVEEAIQQAASITDLDVKVRTFASNAQTLWRMGDRANATRFLTQAERAAATISYPTHRAAQLRFIARQKIAFQQEPPSLLSLKVRPPFQRHNPPAPPSTLPSFPITVEGFRHRTGEALARAAQENGEYLTRLYELVAAKDNPGIWKHIESAYSPFQRALGLATVEHLQLQGGMVQDAENTASMISDDGADCSLAKAEAFIAAGVSWARKEESERARLAFEVAIRDTQSASKDLAFGKVKVLSAVAGAQAESGLVASARDTLELAWKAAATMPTIPIPFPRVISGRETPPVFRHDGYRVIFEASIRIHDLAAARRTAQLWKESNRDADIAITAAWLSIDQREEAIAYVRSLKNASDRTKALLFLTERLLARAGGPIL